MFQSLRETSRTTTLREQQRLRRTESGFLNIYDKHRVIKFVRNSHLGLCHKRTSKLRPKSDLNANLHKTVVQNGQKNPARQGEEKKRENYEAKHQLAR